MLVEERRMATIERVLALRVPRKGINGCGSTSPKDLYDKDPPG